ncbi:MAG: histidine kinase [Cyclobacteriaceae bacterium]
MAKIYSNSEFENILIYFTHSILDQSTEEEIAWNLAKNCISKLGFEDCVVYFIDEKNEVLIQKAAYGPKNPKRFEIADPIFIPVGSGITGSVAKNAKSEIIADTSKDDRYIMDDACRFSEISVPIIVDGKVFGVIDCEHSEKNFFTEQHLRILEAFASICSVIISKIRAEKAYKENQEHLLNVQRELLSIKIEALRTQMNPHFLFNAINSIQYFITIGDKRSSLLFLTTFSKLIRYYLNHFEKDEVTIQGELQLMRWYFTLQKMRYVDKFDFEITSQVTDYQSGFKIPSMILGSFTESVLENSIIDNELKAKVKVKAMFSHDKFQLTAIYTTTKGNVTKRLVNYRENLASWEEQIELLNRLRNLKIEKTKAKRIITKKNLSIELVRIIIPIIE